MHTPHIVPVDPLIPFRDALPMMGVRLTKGYAEIQRGRLSVIRNGRRTFVRASEVERYIRSLETGSVKEAA